LASQQQIYGQPGQTGGFRNNMHFAKSECPSPNQRMIDERKGHTQARFFSRKNSNSN
jgi:hypothetical protein